ncbi:MAG: SCO family protein [Acidobacteriota bacterium]
MKKVLFVMIALLSALTASRSQAQSTVGQEADSPAKHYFTDVTLVNQSGEQLRFYSDLLKGRVVVINVFFSSCHGSCPVMMGTFQKLQDWLGDRLGKDVYLISMSVDPTIDTPEKLKEFATQMKAKRGWHFVTGEKKNMELALRKIGQYVEVRENHSNIFIIGNEVTGLWKKAFGLAKIEEIIKVVESVLNDKG